MLRYLTAVFAWVGCLVLLTAAEAARGHETDNYYLPLDRQFADLGGYLNAVHTRVIEESVRGLNGDIERSLSIRDPVERAASLRRAQDPEALVRAVNGKFSDAFTELLELEDAVRGQWARQSFPNQITAHSSINWMYTWVHFPLDPRRLVLLFQSSTIKAFGVYFGTDKLSHFHHMGNYYYQNYRTLLAHGDSPDVAVRKIIRTYSTDSPLAETGLLGYWATGVYSNGDMCANYMGFKFLLNLTETVTLKGEVCPPLVERCGVYWKVSQRVRPGSGWFGAFVSDHWNEALNPNLYDLTIRSSVRSLLQRRADHIMEFYTRCDGRPNDASYYARLRDELRSYYGEDYGHGGRDDELMTLGDTCIPAVEEHALRNRRAGQRHDHEPRSLIPGMTRFSS